MLGEDQQRVVAFLDSVAEQRVETHAAIVFLAGNRAWKLKRAVRFDYLDFSTVERRRLMCEAEVRLNRRTAPAIYRGVVPITEDRNGVLSLAGDGAVVDWVVEMNRFDQADLCDRRAAAGSLRIESMAQLAHAIAAFHAAAEPRRDHGGSDAMRWVIEGNARGFAEFGVFDPDASARLTASSRRAVEMHASLLDARRWDGLVRQCHGDLHLRNIVLLGGVSTLFDAIEFNDELACIDVWYDLAFLLMDLARRELPQHANTVFNRYLLLTQDFEALPLLPLFQSCRAAIRAKTSATAASMHADPERRQQLQQLARDYLAMAERLLRPDSPRVIVIGGLSGTGKSSVAAALASQITSPPGAVVLRSDEIRKQLAGLPSGARLGPEGYTTAISDAVYATLRERAERVIASGHAVIVDAVFARSRERDAVERLAASANVPFSAVWLEAPAPVLFERVAARTDDASDADPAVVRQQLANGIKDLAWTRIDASPSVDAVTASVRAALAHGQLQP